MKADLNVHSYYSDGENSPGELAARLRSFGIEIAALADHDTVAGTREFAEAAKRQNMQAVNGIELSTFSSWEIHILGYNFDIEGEAFSSAISRLRDMRRSRLLGILEKLKELGIALSEEDVVQKAGVSESAGRVHVAKVLIDRGICSSVNEAFDKLIGYGKPAYVPSYRISPREGIEIIKSGGGKAVLAHPFLIEVGQPSLVSLVRELKGLGLDGIEARYSAHTTDETRFLLKLAKDEKLIATCGSDYHGESRNSPITPFELSAADYQRLID